MSLFRMILASTGLIPCPRPGNTSSVTSPPSACRASAAAKEVANGLTALADAYYAACMLYPEQFADIDPEVKAGEIFTELLGSNPYPDLKEAGYAFRAITIGE